MAKPNTQFCRLLNGARVHWLDDHFEFTFMLASFDATMLPDLVKACKKRKWTLITNDVGFHGDIHCKIHTK